MPLININLDPSPRELKWFGLLVFLLFGLIGGLVFWQAQSLTAPTVLWSIGAALALLYYSSPPIRRALYLGWMHAVFPIGWVVSHLLMALIFYLVFTPIGLTMRLFRRDPMLRRFEPKTGSYWVEHRTGVTTSRYFRQF